MIAVFGISFALCLFLGFPIALALGGASIVPSLLNPGFAADASVVLRGALTGINSTSLLALPMFILSGVIMSGGGISKRLFNVFAYLLGNRTAGLPCAVIVTCLFYGAISGSGVATCAAVGGMSIPILVSLGYDKRFCAALVSASAGLGLVIPPSVIYIIYSEVTGVSMLKLFTAGLLPGCTIAACLMIFTFAYCKINGEDKEKIRANQAELRAIGFFPLLKESFWALLTPVIILGSIYSGIVTPTEAAVISVFYALIVSIFIYKSIKPRDIIKMLKEAVPQYAGLLILLALATAFARVVTYLDLSVILTDVVTSTFKSKYTVLIIVNIIMLLMGMFMDTGPCICILAPIALPVLTAMGVDPVHLGIIMTVNVSIGLVSPPFGLNLFVMADQFTVPVGEIAKKAFMFTGVLIIALLLVTYIPQLSLLLL